MAKEEQPGRVDRDAADLLRRRVRISHGLFHRIQAGSKPEKEIGAIASDGQRLHSPIFRGDAVGDVDAAGE